MGNWGARMGCETMNIMNGVQKTETFFNARGYMRHDRTKSSSQRGAKETTSSKFASKHVYIILYLSHRTCRVSRPSMFFPMKQPLLKQCGHTDNS